LENFIAISDNPSEMYGQVMSIVDDVIFDYFELVTRVSMAEIEEMKQAILSGQNPVIFKKRLAREIISFYHGEKKANHAEESFEKTFARGGVPEDVGEASVTSGTMLVDVLLAEKIIESKSEFRRLVSEGAITEMNSDKKITDEKVVAENGVYKIGKRRFIKIKITK
jgi:tyrosyl-tRNA synthetase